MPPGNPLAAASWAAWRWYPLFAGDWWHAEYGIASDEGVTARQHDNLAALLGGHSPTADQRGRLLGSIIEQVACHAANPEYMARTAPAFAVVIGCDQARAACADTEWLATAAASLGL